MAQFSQVNCRYGAPMGRRSSPAEQRPSGSCRLFRVLLNSGGYDNGNAYWGNGPPDLYCCTDDCDFNHFVRANSRAEAARILIAKYGPITFKVRA